MDIEYLLLLQNFRHSINDAWTPFMEWISLFAVTYLIMIPVFVYWAVDKKKGLYTLFSYALSCGFNAVVKLTVCLYRPWIRDPRVVPAGDAITTATGYSFPSGHTTTAGPIYGGLAVGSWKEKKWRWISVICVILALITGFSRNYLGVHHPQDVIVGFMITLVSLFAMYKIFQYLEKHPEKENMFLLISFILGWIGIIYITFKPYPMTYINGELLVDPQKMMNDGYGDIALLIVFPVARFIERRFINFKAAALKGKGLIVSIIGLIPLYLMINYMKPPLDEALGSHWGHFTYTCIFVLYYIAGVPAVIKAVSDKEPVEETEEAAAA